MRLLAIDTETTGVAWDDDAFMISIATSDFPYNDISTHVWDKREEYGPGHWYDVVTEMIPSLFDSHDKIIMHNAKFDIQKLIRLGVSKEYFTDTTKWEDTQALAHLYNEHESTGLKHLAKVWLGEETDEAEVLRAYRRKNKLTKEDGFEKIPFDVLAPYAKKDAEYTLSLFLRLDGSVPVELMPLYTMEKELTLALLDIEAAGMRIDREYVKRKRIEYGDRIFHTKKRIAEIAGEDFNPQSPQQIIAFFAEQGISTDKTDKATLASLDHEMANLIVLLREDNKIKRTYFDALFEESKSGVLHPNFRQHGTRTGRMSSGAAES